MSTSFFAGAYAGDVANLSDQARLECKICWYVYDPGLGDEVGQIPENTPFAELPAHWRCPVCDASKQDFLLLDD